MNYFVEILSVLVPVLYALATANCIAHFVTQSEFARRADRPLLLATVVVHAVFLGLKSAELGRCPMGNIFEATALMAFSLMAVYLYLTLRTGTRPTGILVLPIAFLLQIFASAAPEPEGAASDALASVWFDIHVLAAILGFAALAVSFVHGVFYLHLYRQIKAHRFGLFFRRLPPLAALKRVTEHAAVAGWTLLTVTIAGGAIHARQSGRLADLHGDPMFLIVCGAWALYSLGLAVRYLAGRRGRYTVYLSVVGFAALMASLVFVSSVHGFN